MKRVLIIEDDRDIVELVRYNLANEGFQVSAAGDGSAGLAGVVAEPERPLRRGQPVQRVLSRTIERLAPVGTRGL